MFIKYYRPSQVDGVTPVMHDMVSIRHIVNIHRDPDGDLNITISGNDKINKVYFSFYEQDKDDDDPSAEAYYAEVPEYVTDQKGFSTLQWRKCQTGDEVIDALT